MALVLVDHACKSRAKLPVILGILQLHVQMASRRDSACHLPAAP